MHRFCLALSVVLVLVGCGADAAPPSSSPAPTVVAAAPSTVVPAPSVVPPPSVVPAPSAVAPPTTEAMVDLLRAVPTTLTVSSAYRDQDVQPTHLVDQDLETAWNSRTGDLVGAWIEVQLPPEAHVGGIALTPGFTSTGPRDLFTTNHRVTEVHVTHDGVDAGTFPLDPELRTLQTLPVTGGGGTYRITLTQLRPGSRTDWREACVSELRVMGTAPETSSSTPTFAIAPAPGVDAGPALAAPTPMPPVPDSLVLRVAGTGLVRIGTIVEVLSTDARALFAVDARGDVAIVESGHLFLLAGGVRRELRLPFELPVAVALGSDGGVLVGRSREVARSGRGDAWISGTIDEGEEDFEAEQVQALAVGGHGEVYARGQHSIFHAWGSSDRSLSFTTGYVRDQGDLNVIAVAASDAGMVAATDRVLSIERSHELVSYRPFESAAIRVVTIGSDGTVAAGAADAITIVPPGAAPANVTVPGLGLVISISRDSAGRTWASGTGGLVVIAADGSIAHQWARDAVPGVNGAVAEVAVCGAGPALLSS